VLAAKRTYSAVRHLALSLNPSSNGHSPMAMFTAHFDASGKERGHGRAPALYVAGWVAPTAKWTEFEKSWATLLRQFDIVVPFHMTDFMAGKGKFRTWSGDEARKTAFRLEAVRLLQKTTDKPFAVGVVVRDLKWLFERYEVPATEPRHPYAWCSIMVCGQVAVWLTGRAGAKRTSRDSQVKIVFESGDDGRSEFEKKLWAKHRIEVAFETNYGKTFAPFAACDFLGWEFRNWISRRAQALDAHERAQGPFLTTAGRIEAKRRVLDLLPPGDVILEIARLLPKDALGMMNREGLARLAKVNGWPERS
jgi:hypothetical protein